MSLNRKHILVYSLLWLGLAAVPAGAEAPDTPSEPPAAESPESSAHAPVHPLAAEVHALREATHERLQALEQRRLRALDAQALLAIQREIAAAKLDFELGMLHLQRDHQEALGRRVAEDELGLAIERLEQMRAELGVKALQPSASQSGNAEGAQ